MEAALRCGESAMACRSCGSENQTEFGAEINIHFPGRKGLDKPAVLVFPKLVVCLDCGFTQFTLPEAELRLLGQGAADLVLRVLDSQFTGNKRLSALRRFFRRCGFPVRGQDSPTHTHT
jgi:hypothetical protein